MKTITKNFPAKEIQVEHQTGIVLRHKKGFDTHLHTRDGEILPCCAEMDGGDGFYAEIGLEWTGGVLTGYDGVFYIPLELLDMLEGEGFKIDPELRER